MDRNNPLAFFDCIGDYDSATRSIANKQPINMIIHFMKKFYHFTLGQCKIRFHPALDDGDQTSNMISGEMVHSLVPLTAVFFFPS